MQLKKTTNDSTDQNELDILPTVISDKFICPVCNAKLFLADTHVSCVNDLCKTLFPVINGIPILINERDSIFNIKDFTIDRKDSGTPRVNGFLKFLKGNFPTLSNNLSSKKNFEKLEELLSVKTNPKVLIVGGATITTDTELIFNEKNIIVESDIYFGPRTKIIFDAHDIPFEDESFDLIIFQAVLEHVADPYKCVEEAHRVLKNDGVIFAATPFMQQVHMRAFDFTRFTHLGHRRLFRKFEEIDSGVSAGTGVALGWSIKYFLYSLSDQKFIRLFFKIASSLLLFWLKYIDLIIKNNMGSYDAASAFYFVGRKSKEVLSDKELVKLYKGF
ncbi:methyltransferase domain-containing protein [Arcticibacterium luteifluviistationis]|uniref:Methyltransferase type 11 n=1 Tax=Arcticibacterium luteifluviistationis TaxID=1784714 RepID=A0A2Z4GFB0_9BACT|nr:methyltransferase domain-containing protein [Arcticibacterium luteifluviistationis]AWV99851.1 methyltransferase type 11 [Arcticibacterium luteifluviistationis]